MKTNFLLLLFLSVFISSCDKETPKIKCKEVRESSKDFLNYWYFPTGSWWVYELKESPGVYDTVRVIDQNQKYYERCMDDDCYNGFFDCSMVYYTRLTHTNKDYFIVNAGVTPFEDYYAQDNRLQVSGSMHGNQIYGQYIFIYPIQIGYRFENNFEIPDSNKVVTPLKTFNQSVHIKSLLPANADTIKFGNFSKSLFFTKNVGLTKRVYTGNQTWELVNYFINK